MENLLIVNSKVLPDIFLKVVETKHLIASGAVKNATEAIKITGISRGAFYKYKDYVDVYDKMFGNIITFQGVLSDTPGVLSEFISVLYKYGANILTVNQDLPIDGKASVSVTVSCEHVDSSVSLIEKLNVLDGILSLSQIIG